MRKTKITEAFSNNIAPLVLVSVLFVGFAMNTNLGAANTYRMANDALRHVVKKATKEPVSLAQNLQVLPINVLSPKDAELYRAIFAAQAKGDWAAADDAIHLVNDTRLMGHVQADRMMRRGAHGYEAQLWLASYNDLPQAPLIRRVAALKTGNLVKLDPTYRPARSDWAGGSVSDAADDSFGLQTEGGDSLFRLQWLKGLKAWRIGDIGNAAAIFKALATTDRAMGWDRAAADFWAYRAYKRMGNREQAYAWLRKAADQPRSFYGMLANDLMGRDLALSWNLPQLDGRLQAVLKAYPAGYRAMALVQVGQNELAEHELQHINPVGRHTVLEAMLSLVGQASMPALALRLGAMAVNDNNSAKDKLYDAALYPVPSWQPQGGFGIERSLLYAIMRHESHFDVTATSDHGACGLMQLMPSTARAMADDATRKSWSRQNCPNQLFDPATNMGLGQGYVEDLASQPAIRNNLLMLLAAYNTGPNRLAHWQDDAMRRDPLLFIESLPVHETRDYVQHVTMHYIMYRARLGQSLQPLHQLARGEWPHVDMHDTLEAALQPAMPFAPFKVASK